MEKEVTRDKDLQAFVDLVKRLFAPLDAEKQRALEDALSANDMESVTALLKVNEDQIQRFLAAGSQIAQEFERRHPRIVEQLKRRRHGR